MKSRSGSASLSSSMDALPHFKRLRVGVIGTGIFATNAHLPAMLRMPERFEIVAVCNRSEEKAFAYAAKAKLPEPTLGLNVYQDYRQLLAREDVEAVVVALPVSFNLEVCKAALEKGKHVLVEKPIAHSLDDAREIVRLANYYRANKGLCLMVAENYPYKKSTQAMADVVAGGKLGNVICFNLTIARQFSPQSNVYLTTSWRQSPEHPGGFLSDGGVHWVSLLTSVLGPVRSISAFTRRIEEANGAEDTISATVMLESGAIGTWALTFASGGASHATFNVIGNKGNVSLFDMAKMIVTTKTGKRSEVVFEGEGLGDKLDIVAEFEDFHRVATFERPEIIRKEKPSGEKEENEEGRKEEEEFVFVEGGKPRVSVEEAFHHLAVVVAALQSMKSMKVEGIASPSPSAAE
ncbi:Lissencephaly-1 [Balamuthia mandrillaris]